MSEAEPFDLVAALADTARIRADYIVDTRQRLHTVQQERDRLAAQVARIQHLIDTADAWAIPLDYVREALHGKPGDAA